MKSVRFGSAVFTDADRKPCGEDVFGCVHIAVMRSAAVRARPCPDIESSLSFGTGLRPAVRAQLGARIVAVDYHKLPPVPFGLVFEHAAQFTPTGIEYVPVRMAFRSLPVGKVMGRVGWVRFRRAPAGQVLHCQILDHDCLVITNQCRGQFVQEVTAHVRKAGVGARDLERGFPVVVAALPFAGQCVLFPFELGRELGVMAWVADDLPLAGDGEGFHTEVDADRIGPWWQWCDMLFDEKAHMPAPRRVQADRHRAGRAALRQGARPSYRQRFAHLREGEFMLVLVPCERAARELGAAAMRLAFEPWIITHLFEETRERGLQMPERLLQGDARHVVHVRVLVGLFPSGEHRAGLRVRDIAVFGCPCGRTRFQRHVVHLSLIHI